MSQWFVFIHKETEAQGEGREEMEEQGLKSRSPQPPTLQAHGPQCLLLKNHLFNLPQIHETLFEKAHDHRIGTEKKKKHYYSSYRSYFWETKGSNGACQSEALFIQLASSASQTPTNNSGALPCFLQIDEHRIMKHSKLPGSKVLEQTQGQRDLGAVVQP